MILLWGLPEDSPMAAVHAVLQTLEEPVVLLDQHNFRELEVEWTSESGVPGTVRVGTRVIELEEVTAAYLRPYEPACVLPRVSRRRSLRDWQHAVEFAEALWGWAELTPALVLNRPTAMASNNSKPWQSALIGEHGFRTPATVVTNDPRVAREFWAEHGTVIYKSISGQRSLVTRLSSRSSVRWKTLHWCPTQFQEHITGTDVRVHVVGTEAFASVIHCEADDYRYPDGVPRRIEPFQLPEDCRARCVDLAQALGLTLAGIDLRRTPDGEWFCFEVNPSPGFTYYQSATDQPIDVAIARLLVEDSPQSHDTR